MADAQSTVDGAVQAAAGVANQAANGSVWAFGVFALLVAAALAGLWIWRSTGRKPEPDDDDPDPSCKPASAEGCPAIRELVLRVDGLTRQIELDRQEWQEHRREVKDTVTRLHERIDDQHDRFATKSEMLAVANSFQHYAEEVSRLLTGLRAPGE